MTFNIETERLLLRDIKAEDLEGMFALDSNPNVHEYLGKKPIKTKAEAQHNIEKILHQYKTLGIGRFAVIEKETNQFIGWSGLKFNTGEKESLGDKREFYDVGYRLIERFWNKGYAGESAIASLDYGFKELKLDVIVGAAETGNIASNKILKKIGLQYVEQFPFKNEMINWYELKKEEYAKNMS
ncbi:GNAT family N-acetyltransferase [Lacinutrix sp. Bg11-31]|uniref:GNAT family N-acetyltransferase n=1 Tax=Lacinutrix sp. Bg11-31 TaxID=2057808 RepID=UPI000C30CC11|nr:GNAT family N-acetyltransferase [Lacinutrix sp. Bg11-31]AUC82794.1 GNAT family N-acetyltransferase [Lacinutrix sp. Bg11-31]